MTVYGKGFKICRQKIANLIKVTSPDDTLVDSGLRVLVEGLNRDAYIRITTGYEGIGPEGERNLELIIVLAIDHDEERLRKKELGPIDESILFALPHTLVGPDVWELF